MPLTREQLAELREPNGWVLHTRPSLRTVGYVHADLNQGLSATNAVTRLAVLVGWAKENELGLKPVVVTPATLRGTPTYQYINTNYWDLRFPCIFRVSANHPEYTDETFGSNTCFCGRMENTFANPACADCGRVHCENCALSYIKLYKVAAGNGEIMACHACTQACPQDANHRTYSTNPCAICNPSFHCALCFKKRADDGTAVVPTSEADRQTMRTRYERQYGRHMKTDPKVCGICSKAHRCKTCGRYDFTRQVTSTGECVLCAGKEFEKERLKHEAFPDGWIPRHGSLTIPSVAFRPFRTISYELELDGDGDLVAQTLYRCGLVPMSTVAGYQQHADINKAEYPCFMKHDGSVGAGEIIAYLLNLDDEKHAEALMDTCRKVNSLVQMKKASFGPTCGGHIHADAHNFSYGDVWRLLTGFNYIEDPFYRIAGAGSPYGHRSLDPASQARNGEGYSNSPVKGPFGTKGALGRSIQAQRRNSGLNFTPYISAAQMCECGSMAYEDSKNCKCNLGKATIEFRLFNSTANPRILHAWIALVQALMAWSEGDVDPTPEWEKQYDPLPWAGVPYAKLSTTAKTATCNRVEWMFRNLPLTEDERDSLAYAVEQSDIEISGDRLRAIVPLNDFPHKKPPRNPARRKRAIKMEAPAPGSPETPAIVRGNPATHFIRSRRSQPSPPLAEPASSPDWTVSLDERSFQSAAAGLSETPLPGR